MSMNEAAMQARINFLVDQHADLVRAYTKATADRDLYKHSLEGVERQWRHELARAAAFANDINTNADKVAQLTKERDTALEAAKREQQQFASLATEKREVVERLNGQLYERNNALAASSQECLRLKAVLSQAYQDIELLKAAGRKVEEQLAQARSAPPRPATPTLPNCAYRLSFGPELTAQTVNQGDCVVIVIRHSNRAPVMPSLGISRVD